MITFYIILIILLLVLLVAIIVDWVKHPETTRKHQNLGKNAVEGQTTLSRRSLLGPGGCMLKETQADSPDSERRREQLRRGK